MVVRVMGFLSVLVLALGMGCGRPLGACFGDGGPPGWDGGRPEAGIPDGAVNLPPVARCEAERFAAPGRPITLFGAAEDDWGIAAWEWWIAEGPADSTPVLSDAQLQNARFTADVVGDFRVALAVRDLGGLASSCQTLVRSRVDPPLVTCPTDQTVPTRTNLPLHGAATDDGYIVSWRWQVVSHDTDTDPLLSPTTAADTTFQALRAGHYVLSLTVTDEHGLTDICQVTVTATPTGPDSVCPADVAALPLTPVVFTGSWIDDGTVVSHRWELIDRPSGSSAAPPAPADAGTASFVPDVAGVYTVQLTVVDDDGNVATCTFEVHVTPGELLRVELFWNPPENPNDLSDVDLHLLHPSAPAWFDTQWDCHYSNCNVSNGYFLYWDGAGTADDPRLDLDDTSGYGPENINIEAPVVGHVYRVGVHFFGANGGPTPARAHVKIYCGTASLEPIYEVGPVALSESGSPWDQNDFWKVADVTWDGLGCQVTPLGAIVTASQAQASR